MREDWIEIELGEVLKLKNGFAFKSSKYRLEGIPIIRISDINQGIVTADKAKRITENEEYNDYQVEFGDILIAMSGATTGKFGIYKSNQKTYQNQRVGKLKLHNDKLLDKNYIYYLLYSLRQTIEKVAYGGAQPNISGKKVEALEFKLAPLPEQRAIVAKIEQLFSELDNGIANLKAAKDKLEIYRQAVLKKAFEGELTKEWRKQQTDLPTADELLEQIKDERLKQYENQLLDWEEAVSKWEASGKQGKKPRKTRKPKFSENVKFEEAKIDKIPFSWCLTEIQNISDLVTDGTHHTPKYTDTGVKFISVKDIYDEVVHFDKCKYVSEKTHLELINRCHPQKGDLLITKSGTIGRLAIVPDEEFSLFVSVALIKLQSAKKYLHPKWVYYSVKFHVAGLNVAHDIKGGLIKNYHLEDLRVAKIILAPLKEQERVIEEIETRLSICDNILANIEEGLKKSEALRQSILKQAFNGKLLSEEELEACRKEPDWEPAEKLLERIKNDKK